MEYEIKQNFSRNLAILRKSKNLTQAQLAEKLNYTDKSVSKWEMNQALPQIDKVLLLCELFCVSADDLLNDKNSLDRAERKSKNK